MSLKAYSSMDEIGFSPRCKKTSTGKFEEKFFGIVLISLRWRLNCPSLGSNVFNPSPSSQNASSLFLDKSLKKQEISLQVNVIVFEKNLEKTILQKNFSTTNKFLTSQFFQKPATRVKKKGEKK